jgi:hypothetical protein
MADEVTTYDPVTNYTIGGARVSVFAPNGTSRHAIMMIRTEDAQGPVIIKAVAARLGIAGTSIEGQPALRRIQFEPVDPQQVVRACGELAAEFPTKVTLEAAYPPAAGELAAAGNKMVR